MSLASSRIPCSWLIFSSSVILATIALARSTAGGGALDVAGGRADGRVLASVALASVAMAGVVLAGGLAVAGAVSWIPARAAAILAAMVAARNGARRRCTRRLPLVGGAV